MEEERPSMGTVYEVDFLEKFDELVRRYAEDHAEEFKEWKGSRRRKKRPPEGEGHENYQGNGTEGAAGAAGRFEKGR